MANETVRQTGSTRWLTDEEQRTWRAYLDATRLLLQNLDRQLERDSDISFTDFEVLVVLSEADGHGVRMSEIADAMTTTRSGVTRAVTRLVKSGWVRRVPYPGDKRGMVAELTAAGAAKLAEASIGHVAAVRANIFDGLTGEQVRVLGEACGEMRARMETLPVE